MAKKDSAASPAGARDPDAPQATAKQTEAKRQQQELFAPRERSRAEDERLVLRALGDFQKRGKVLADRDLPIDRLRGALRREAARSETAELTDERFAEALSALGAHVKRVPAFVAKHPFRVTVPAALAARALEAIAEEDATA